MRTTLKVIGFTLVASLYACAKEEVINNYYAAPEEARGSALGFVYSYDEFGAGFRYNDGIRVTVKATTPLISVVSDTNGRYQLNGLRAGNYVLTYDKPGYGSYEQEFMLAAAGGNQPVLVTQQGPFGPVSYQRLFQQSTTVASNLQISQRVAIFDLDTALVITGTLTPGSTVARPRAIALLFDTLAHVSVNNFIAGFILSSSGNAVSGSRFTFSVSLRDLLYYRQYYSLFKPGSRYYARAFGAPSSGVSGYLNRENGRYVYSSLNPQSSNKLSFVVQP